MPTLHLPQVVSVLAEAFERVSAAGPVLSIEAGPFFDYGATERGDYTLGLVAHVTPDTLRALSAQGLVTVRRTTEYRERATSHQFNVEAYGAFDGVPLKVYAGHDYTAPRWWAEASVGGAA